MDDLNAPTVDVSKQRDTESATYVHTPTGDGLYAPTVGVNSVASRDAYSPPVGVSQTPTVKTAFREQFPTDEDRDVNEPREPSAGTSLLQFSIAAPPTLDSFAWFQSLNGKQLFDARGVRRIAVVQDILSNVEFGYYRKLWDAAGGEFRVISKDDRVKVFQAGYATLSRLLNMDRRSVAKYVVDAFEAKYVMEVAEEGRAASRTCAIYRLFSYREILDRLRAAGCVYAKKHGKTVYLVRALNQGFPSAPVGVSSPPTVGDSDPPSVQVSDTPTVAKTSTVGDTPIQSVGVSPIGSVDVSGRPSLLGFKRGNSLGEYDDVVVELEKLILESPYSQFDRYGIATIVKQSRERVPDITASEIYTLFQEKARTLAGNRKIDNFIGVLLWAWPGFFTETRVFSLREAIRKQKEEDQKRREETIAMYRQFVNDPSMPDNWREEARRFLADAENEQHKAE